MEMYLIPRKASLAFLGILLFLVLIHNTSIIAVGNLIHQIPIFCPFKAITGIPCPGCGMTRAMTSLIQGDFFNAALLNPFSFFLIFMLILSSMPRSYIARQSQRTTILMRFFFIFITTLVAVYWIGDRVYQAILLIT